MDLGKESKGERQLNLLKDPHTGEKHPLGKVEGTLYDSRGIAIIIPECCEVGMQVVMNTDRCGWYYFSCGKWKMEK
jgi:hypothetical protein